MWTIVLWMLFPLFVFGTVRPVPWLTEGAIAFLEEYLLKNPEAKILEFGSGASTIWLAKRTPFLISVEHNLQWHELIKKMCIEQGLDHVQLHLIPMPYDQFAQNFEKESFDLILIDGRNRKGCILHSIHALKKGGVLMLDNAERPYYQKGIDLLKTWKHFEAEQIHPDACGFMYLGWITAWWIKPD